MSNSTVENITVFKAWAQALLSKKTVWRFLKYYALFASLNVLAKAVKEYLEVKRRIRLWKHVPGEAYDPSGKRELEGAYRLNDYYAETALKKECLNAHFVKTCGPTSELICNSVQAVQFVLKEEFLSFAKPFDGLSLAMDLLAEFVGSSLNDSHGKEVPEQRKLWLEHRKVTASMFSPKALETIYYKAFHESGVEVTKFINEKCERNEVLDFQDLAKSFTMDVSVRLFFGMETTNVQNGQDEYSKSFDETFKWIMFTVLDLMPYTKVAKYAPYPFGKFSRYDSSIGLIYYLKLKYFSKPYQEFKKARSLVHTKAAKFVKEMRADTELMTKSELNALNLFITAAKKNRYSKTVDDKFLTDLVVGITVAGRDTTSSLITFCFYVLCMNPVVQDRLFEELNSKLPKDKDYVITTRDLHPDNLPYLNGVMFEAIRLYPSAPMNYKYNRTEIVAFDGTVIPKNTKMVLLPWAMGRNETLYPDPLEVKPERWIPFSEKKPTDFQLPAFSGGLRNCIGKDVAKLETALFMANVIRKFKVKLVESERAKLRPVISLTLALCNDDWRRTHNFWVEFEKRA